MVLHRVTKPVRRAGHQVVVTTTKTLDKLTKGITSALNQLSKGTRKVSKKALMIRGNGKKRKRTSRRRRRRTGRRRRRRTSRR